ncbi:MAG: hypothetical protein IPG39_20995 [Bacteroidetes bacterium]|nr:hypothetical protein [Bacteroidota bacterium]
MGIELVATIEMFDVVSPVLHSHEVPEGSPVKVKVSPAQTRSVSIKDDGKVIG